MAQLLLTSTDNDWKSMIGKLHFLCSAFLSKRSCFRKEKTSILKFSCLILYHVRVGRSICMILKSWKLNKNSIEELGKMWGETWDSQI